MEIHQGLYRLGIKPIVCVSGKKNKSNCLSLSHHVNKECVFHTILLVSSGTEKTDLYLNSFGSIHSLKLLSCFVPFILIELKG